MNTPNPSIMARFAKPATSSTLPTVVAAVEASDEAKIVRPGLREQVTEVEHDGVVKAKHLKPGQVVQAWLHGAPRGGKREVKSVTRSEDGASVTVEFASSHPTTEYKAAYRFYDASLRGTTVRHVTKVAALVAYEEV